MVCEAINENNVEKRECKKARVNVYCLRGYKVYVNSDSHC